MDKESPKYASSASSSSEALVARWRKDQGGNYKFPPEYFDQFRDLILLVDQTGRIIFKDKNQTSLLEEHLPTAENITSLFPDFLTVLKSHFVNRQPKAAPFSSFALENNELELVGRCYNLGGLLSINLESFYLVTLHNPSATGFMIDLLSDKPKEYVRTFAKENVKQFIYFSNEMKNFVEIFSDQLAKNYQIDQESVVSSAVRYVRDQVNHFRSFFLHQSSLLQNKGYEYSVNDGGDITLANLTYELSRFAQNIPLDIDSKRAPHNFPIRGEKNWLEYAFKNIANLIVSGFPEIKTIKLAVKEKTDRNQIVIMFDLSAASADNLGQLYYVGDQSASGMFYNCYKIVEMNRGSLKFDKKNKILNLTLPLLNRDAARDRIIVMIADADWKSRQRCLSSLSKFGKNVIHFEASDPESALRMMLEIEPDLLIVDPFFYSDSKGAVDFIESMYLSQVSYNPECIIFTHFNMIFDKLVKLSERYNFTFLRKEITDVELKMALAQATGNARNLKVLEELAQNARRASEIDSLTGAFNRSFYDQFIKREIKKAQKSNSYLSLILIDIDDFKTYNDKNGHLAGDYLLRDFVSLLKDKVRATDYVIRYGGEEFIVVLINAIPQSVEIIAEKLRSAIEEHSFRFQNSQPSGNLTASFGVSNFPSDGDDPEGLFRNADKRLYQAKKAGRNRIITA